jgi:hypothetical protein
MNKALLLNRKGCLGFQNLKFNSPTNTFRLIQFPWWLAIPTHRKTG